jgi:hypothetical protein
MWKGKAWLSIGVALTADERRQDYCQPCQIVPTLAQLQIQRNSGTAKIQAKHSAQSSPKSQGWIPNAAYILPSRPINGFDIGTTANSSTPALPAAEVKEKLIFRI